MEGTKAQSNGKVRIPMFVLLVMLIILAFCLTAIILAINMFESNPTIAGYLLLGGVLALAAATYALMQVRRRVASLRIEAPPVTTTIECKKCGFKSVRPFQRGDYVFKEAEKCEKCSNPMTVTAIFKEIKEKDKEHHSF